MEYMYINPDTKEIFYPVYIHNTYKRDKTQVRVMGNCKLNPEDKNYPDKKIVNVKDLFMVEPVNFDDDFINRNSF